MHTHEQCGTRGYINFRPQGGTQPPPMNPGERHTLRAELHGRDLTVTADGAAAWQGPLGTLPLPAGPAGFRTDNARVTFRFLTDALTGSHPAAQQPTQCVMSEGD
jgi:hypothetical protein